MFGFFLVLLTSIAAVRQVGAAEVDALQSIASFAKHINMLLFILLVLEHFHGSIDFVFDRLQWSSLFTISSRLSQIENRRVHLILNHFLEHDSRALAQIGIPLPASECALIFVFIE